MSALTPQPLEALLARALAELDARRSIFDFPRRSFWRTPDGLSLDVESPGGIAGTPLGPAAGPHTQMAQNIVIGWLAGARFVELKTVQVLDTLDVSKPCIDAVDVGYNVEWSQELRIEESTRQYAIAWLLVHALHARGVTGEPESPVNTHFDASVGYDLAGIRSAPVARFLDTLIDAGPLLEELRGGVHASLRPVLDVEVPSRIVSGVTLSTFHGCPADEIEQIIEHVLTRHHLHVVVKLNPTLLGYDGVESLLHEGMGYKDVKLDRESFEKDLAWDHAVQMFERLGPLAAREGLTLGAKFSNTLIVRNTRGRLAGEMVYLSGAPLHPIATRLADRFAQATGGSIPLSFSAGVDAENVAETVACGFRPVTVCTDLLRPTGYRRLPRQLKSLVAAMEQAGARTIPEYILASSGVGVGAASDAEAVRAAAAHNLSRYADTVADNPRYAAAQHQAESERRGALTLLDCESCNNCLLTCPNDAFFMLPIAPAELDTWDLVVEHGEVQQRAATFAVTREKQWAVFADFCNACGNCDAFCPEEGGPYLEKPRFYGLRRAFEEAAPKDGFLIVDRGAHVSARFDGALYTLNREGASERFSDGRIEVVLESGERPTATRILMAAEGHVLPLARYHVMRLLRDAVLEGVNPVSAPLLVHESRSQVP